MLVYLWQGFLQPNILLLVDINTVRVSELNSGFDSTLEVDNKILQSVLIDETLILLIVLYKSIGRN